jgi:hypothetical protein
MNELITGLGYILIFIAGLIFGLLGAGGGVLAVLF